MKKYLFLTALVGASLASCTQEEIDLPKTGGDSELITFASPVVGNITRANTDNPYEVGNNYPTDGKFAVWAHYYTGNFDGFSEDKVYMKDVVLKYKENDANNNTINTWAPDSDSGEKNYYWPKNGTLTFIGYSPASAQNDEGTTVTVGATGIKFNNYEVSTDQSEQVDLLFSERSYNQKKYKANDDKTTDDEVGNGSSTTGNTSDIINDPYTGAHLEFKHALSSILFSVKTDIDYSADETVITLTGIKLNNVISKATFDQELTNYVATTNEKPSTGNVTLGNGNGDNWTPTVKSYVSDGGATREEYYTSTYVAYTNTSNANNTGYTLSTTEYWPSTTTNTTGFTNGKRNTDLILIPQKLENITITLNYTIKSKDSTPIAQENTIKLDDTQKADWDRGYRYIYNITIGLEDITVEPYVTPWVDFDSNTATDTKDPIDVNVNDYINN